MCQPLPVRKFKWIENVDNLQIMNHPVDGDKGYVVEVDLEYPKKLHKTHNSYPSATERMVVHKEWMSEYQLHLQKKGNEVEKLVSNLINKNK